MEGLPSGIRTPRPSDSQYSSLSSTGGSICRSAFSEPVSENVDSEHTDSETEGDGQPSLDTFSNDVDREEDAMDVGEDHSMLSSDDELR